MSYLRKINSIPAQLLKTFRQFFYLSDSFKMGYTQRTKAALKRNTSQVESIASSLIKKLEQLAKEREEETEETGEKEDYDETIGTQSITWDEYCQYFDSPINSSSSIESLVDEVTVL